MKAIIYILLSIFVFGIIAQGFRYRPASNQKILIQSCNNSISRDELNLSSAIISNRLKSFNNEKFTIATIPGKNQLLLTLSGKWDLMAVSKLVSQKGVLEFYETYNSKEVQDLLGGEEHLFSFFQGKTPGAETAELGCIISAEAGKVKEYLSKTALQDRCKFAWTGFFEQPEACLYALKQITGEGSLLKGSDIESFVCKREAVSNKDIIALKFKQSATARWAYITRQNINRSIAIVLDNNVLYAPVVRSEITGGNCQITGDFTAEQLKIMVDIVEHGELPSAFNIVK